MNKSQTAVPAVILTVMALMVWYLLWISPQQRYELLFGVEDTIEESEPYVDYSYFSAKVGEIGQSDGTLLYSTTVSDMRVSYSSVKMLLSNYDYTSLDATLFYNGNNNIKINGDYSLIELELNTGSIVGTPKVQVRLNNTIYYENELIKNSKISVKIPFSAFSSLGKDVEIICKFNGNSFLNAQKCVFDSIKLYNYEYYEEKGNDSKTFYLNPTAALAELMELSFNPTQFTEYDAIINVNSRKVFQGSLNNYTKKLSIDLADVPLNDAENIITLQSTKGAEYYLSNISMKFFSLPSGMSERYFVFDIVENAFGESNLVLYMNVTGIIEAGDIHINLLTKDAVFIYPSSKLVLGVNQIEIPIKYFSQKANNLKLSSPEGRIVINNIKLYK
ncbi:MAG: hypothetical protein PHN56_00940 [Candidatus Nanoarchaeia archaeon]|nr:hypothetical protein [Candidatus Nanoarchaeia archaeon]